MKGLDTKKCFKTLMLPVANYKTSNFYRLSVILFVVKIVYIKRGSEGCPTTHEK